MFTHIIYALLLIRKKYCNLVCKCNTHVLTDSMDSMRRCSELGIEMGRQKRSKEIMNWARKKRRMIRREDLLAYLSGKPPPPRPHSHR